MILTEEEAKTKLCPLMRYHARNADNGSAIYEQAVCAGSGCMAWRVTPYNGKRDYVHRKSWRDESNRAAGDTSEPPRPADVPADAEWHPGSYDGEWYPGHWYESDGHFRNRQLAADARFKARSYSGYCGLAGATDA